MSTTNLLAAEVMDRSAVFLNDPSKTDYTYEVQLPHLNAAIDELVESLEESNSSPTSQTSLVITVPIGSNRLTPAEHPISPHYPSNLVEIEGVGERAAGSSDPFIPMRRRDFITESRPTDRFMYWVWEDQQIRFNPNGATVPVEVQLQYIAQAITHAANALSVIGTINARSYLAYKTAASCALFIGENETRAMVLDAQAEKALERLTGINNKGRQQIMTRHRPFRASYKARGGGY